MTSILTLAEQLFRALEARCDLALWNAHLARFDWVSLQLHHHV